MTNQVAPRDEPCSALSLGMNDPCNFEDGYCIRCLREEPSDEPREAEDD